MAAKYQLYKDKAGKFRFRLVAENGRTIATGEAYERRVSCLNGINSVRKNSGSPIEDTTIESPKIPYPKYQIFIDKAGEYRFNLSASNGEVIASSEGYSSKEGCLNGINAVRRIGNSEIEDLTAVPEKQEETTIIKPGPTFLQEVEQSKEPEAAVAQKEVEPATQEVIDPSKQPESEVTYNEYANKTSLPAAAATPLKEVTTSRNEIQTKHKGISIIAVGVLVVGLVIGVILLVVGLGFGGVFAVSDFVTKGVTFFFGLLIICASILFFFAKK